MKLYHGTNKLFTKFDQSKARIVNDFYGGGTAYFTDDIGVAETYAKSMSKRGGDPIIYTCEIDFRKVFDVDASFTGKELIDFLPASVESFARHAKLLKFGSDRFTVVNRLKKGEMTLSGDELFRGLSDGMIQTAKARNALISKGYDGLRYNGGVNMAAKKHNVYIAYDVNKIKILDRGLVKVPLNV